jgi:hypothetical protein
MSKLTSALAIMAVAAGLMATPVAASAASTASAKPAESVYTTSSIDRCFQEYNADFACVNLQAYSTYSATQIWINGHVTCQGQGPDITITWCGVGGGNGTAALNIGVNWNDWGFAAYDMYERMDILAGHGGCTTWGTNEPVGEILWWFNNSITCEAGA